MDKLFSIAAALGIWGTAMALAEGQSTPRFPTNWFNLQMANIDQPGERASAASITVEAAGMMHKWSISFPKVKNLSGRAKFLPNTSSEPQARPLAYEVEVTMPPYEPDKFADPTYKDPNKIAEAEDVYGAYYDLYFTFTLRDAEGFILQEVKTDQSNRYHVVHPRIETGTTNRFRGVTTNGVSPYTAAATKDIDISITAFSARADTDKAKITTQEE